MKIQSATKEGEGFPADSVASRFRAADFDTDALIHRRCDEFFTWARTF